MRRRWGEAARAPRVRRGRGTTARQRSHARGVLDQLSVSTDQVGGLVLDELAVIVVAMVRDEAQPGSAPLDQVRHVQSSRTPTHRG